jgi:hypothetical protein
MTPDALWGYRQVKCCNLEIQENILPQLLFSVSKMDFYVFRALFKNVY